MHWVFTRQVASKPAQDVATTRIAFQTINVSFADYSASTPNATMNAVETAANTYWNVLKAYAHTSHWLSQFRWYQLHVPPAPSGDPMRVNDITSYFIGSQSSCAPPQNAVNLTLETEQRRHWGRMCFPLTGINLYAVDGRISTTVVDNLCNAGKTFLDACKTANLQPSIYSRIDGSMRSVVRCRMDDTGDIIRRRRYEGVPYRKQLTLV